MVAAFLFYILSTCALLSASATLFARDAVRSVFSLILTFFFVSGLWLLIEAEFLAMTLLVVYVGAVMVLFLFVVMMIGNDPAKELRSRYTWVAMSAAGVFMALMAAFFMGRPHLKGEVLALVPTEPGYSNIKVLGEALYAGYLYPFELAGVILLVSIVAAIALVYRGSPSSKKQYPSAQVKVRASDRLTLVSMKSEGQDKGVV